MATPFQGCTATKGFVAVFVTVALTVVLLWLNMDNLLDAGSHTPIQYIVQHMTLLERSQVSYISVVAIASLFLNDPVGIYCMLIVRLLL